jgi:hypothetical protein
MPLRCYNENTRVLILKIKCLTKKSGYATKTKYCLKVRLLAAPLVLGLRDCCKICNHTRYRQHLAVSPYIQHGLLSCEHR